MAFQIIPNFRKPHKKIVQHPDKRLRQVSSKVTTIDSSILQISNKLIEVLKEIDKPFSPWLGMAATQIGYNKRIIAIKRGFHNYLLMVNPEVLDQKWILPAISGCYSLKGLYLIKSPYWSKVKYMDLNGKYHEKIFQVGLAMLMKQEIDHINGKLICD